MSLLNKRVYITLLFRAGLATLCLLKCLISLIHQCLFPLARNFGGRVSDLVINKKVSLQRKFLTQTDKHKIALRLKNMFCKFFPKAMRMHAWCDTMKTMFSFLVSQQINLLTDRFNYIVHLLRKKTLTLT